MKASVGSVRYSTVGARAASAGAAIAEERVSVVARMDANVWRRERLELESDSDAANEVVDAAFVAKEGEVENACVEARRENNVAI